MLFNFIHLKKPLLSVLLLGTASGLPYAHAEQHALIKATDDQQILNQLCKLAAVPSKFTAVYQITVTDKNLTQQANQLLTLTRMNDKIVYQYKDVSFEKWQKDGEYVRYFPQQKHSISYQRSDLLSLNNDANIDQRFHLISQDFRSQLKKVSELDNGCYHLSHYKGSMKSDRVLLYWIPKMQLPLTFAITDKTQSVTYQLTKLTTTSKTEFNALIDGYKDLGFANINDENINSFYRKNN